MEWTSGFPEITETSSAHSICQFHIAVSSPLDLVQFNLEF